MNSLIRLSELIEDWQYLLKRNGIISAIYPIAREITQLPYRHLEYLLYSRLLDDTLPNLPPKMALVIRKFELNDVKLIREINRPSEARLCARRLDRGQYGFIAMISDKVAGYAWVCTKIDARIDKIPVNLDPSDVLCNDAYTTPAYRGQGVQTALTMTRMQRFRELGFRRALCYIDRQNTPSNFVWQQKYNSTIIGQIDFKRIGPWYQINIVKNGISV